MTGSPWLFRDPREYLAIDMDSLSLFIDHDESVVRVFGGIRVFLTSEREDAPHTIVNARLGKDLDLWSVQSGSEVSPLKRVETLGGVLWEDDQIKAWIATLEAGNRVGNLVAIVEHLLSSGEDGSWVIYHTHPNGVG